MKFDFASIIQILEEQKKLYEEILEFSYEKQKVIINNDTIRLNEIVQQEIKRLSLINKAEGNRLASVAAIAAAHGLGSKDMTISHLIELAEGIEKESLMLLQKELAALFFKQEELNKANHKLLETHLEYTETMLNVMLSDEDPLTNYYSGEGITEKEKRHKAGFFDQQI